jgi:hypothetical protein
MHRLQDFGFDKSTYERPNQTWVCGRARDGQCCLAGPDAHGHCTATTECRPLRKGDHWHCTRPTFLGGPCAEGPLPDGACCRVIPKCTPIRSLRSWRGITVMLLVAATLAMLLLTFGSTHGNRVLSPGDLSFSHSSVRNDCAQCHGPLEGRPAGWLAVSVGSLSAHDNSQLCLNCHRVGEEPLQPHSLAPARLQPLTQAVLKKNGPGHPPAGLALASFIASPIRSGEHELACATCHKEHRGNESNLKKLTNQQCQGCHATQFASFADGHPKFTDYPFSRRTRIIFDHQAHFPRLKDTASPASAPHSCLDCHQTDLRGGTMTVKSFEVVCASCHDAQIKGKAAVKTGIAFITIPRMDDRALTGDYAIGEWPGDADAPLTPFLRMLLSATPQMNEAIDALGSPDLSSLPKTNIAKLKAAQTIAWGIKSLIFDLETKGQDDLIRRLRLSAERPLTDRETEGLVAFLNADTLRAAFQSSFPNLQKEVLDYRKSGKPAATQLIDSPPLSPAGPVKPAPPDAWVSQGGWYSPEGSFTLFYHPRGHADRFLSSWMNVTVDADHTANPASSRTLFKELSDRAAVGLCSKCHSIDDAPVSQVNWMAFSPDPNEHPFNRFSHSAHLSLLDTRGCLNCHAMNGTDGQNKGTFASAYEPGQPDPSGIHGNFKTIDKGICANCHQPNRVRDDCLLCHNYHIGRFKPVVANAKIFPEAPPGGKM